MNNAVEEYNVQIGLTPHLKPISEDSTLSEQMNLIVDTWSKKEL